MLYKHAADLYTAQGVTPFVGSDIQIRMTIIRLANGKLLLVDPIPFADELKQEIDALGEVDTILAPNRYHHLYVNIWSSHYPQARVLAAPGLPERVHTLKYDAIIDAQSMAPLADEIQWLLFDAMPILNEIILLHRASRSLIVTDIAFNIQQTDWSLWGTYIRFSGAYKKFGLSHLMKLAVRDRKRAHELIEQILAWNFDRIIVAHGEVIETGGRAALQKAFNWC